MKKADKEPSVHTFEIRTRKGAPKGRPQTGSATEILMDGKPMKGVRKVTFEVEAREIAKMTIEVYGQFLIKSELGSFETLVVPFKAT